MTIAKALGWLLVIGIIAGVSTVGYVRYRQWQVEKFFSRVLVSKDFWYDLPLMTASAPAAVCKTSKSGFAGGDTGSYYFYKGNFRDDSAGIVYGSLQHVHVIIQSTGRIYTWNDDTKVANTFMTAGSPISRTEPDIVDPMMFTGLLISCSPWWSPDVDIFQPPPDITFKE